MICWRNLESKLSTLSCRIALPLVVAALVAGANVASATTFTYSSYSVTNEQNITILTPNSISGGAGQITLIGSGADAGVDIPAWCLDIYVYLTNSGSYTTLGSLTTAGTGSPNPTLTSAQIGQIGSLIVHGDALISNPSTNSTYVSAAIQLAIWEIEYEFTTHGLTFDSVPYSSLATQYVTDVTGGTWAPDPDVLLLIPSGGDQTNQTLAYAAFTPLPSTWTLLLIGLAGLGFFAYRGTRNRSATVALA